MQLDLVGREAREEVPSGVDLVEDDAERVDVDARVEPARRADGLELLGRGIRDGAGEDGAREVARGLRLAAGVGHQLRDPEVRDDDAPRLLLDHDVDGLDVAVDDGLGLLAVRVVQRVGGLDAHAHHFAERKAFVLARVQELTQVLPADQLHGEEVGLAVLPEVVDPHDVAVLESEHHLRFGEEALDDVLGAAGGEGLERVLAAAGRVADVVDHAHSALTEEAEDLVACGDLHGALASSGSTRNSTMVQLSGPPPSLVRAMTVSQVPSRSSPPAATMAASCSGERTR